MPEILPETSKLVGNMEERLPPEVVARLKIVFRDNERIDKALQWVGYNQNKISGLKGELYEEKSFLQKTLRGKLVLYLRWLSAQLKKNPVFAIDHRHDFANAIRNQYKDEETAKNIEELRFPTHLGFLDGVKVGVNSWGAAGNINDYVRLSQYYGEQIKKLFGEKAHRIIDKKEGIKQLRGLQEEFQYLGSGRYISKIDGKEHMGMLFMALKGENQPEWQLFLKMIKKLKGEEHEIKRLFGDRRTVMALIACKKRYGESPQGWIRTLDWLVRRDLPSRYPEVISKAQKEWLEAIEEVTVVVHDELKKDIGKYRGILKKGEDKWIGVWKRNNKELNKKEDNLINKTVLLMLLTEDTNSKLQQRSARDGMLIEESLGRQMQIQKQQRDAAAYTNRFVEDDRIYANLNLTYLPKIGTAQETLNNEIRTLVNSLKKSNDLKILEKIQKRVLKLSTEVYLASNKTVDLCKRIYEELNLKKAPGIVLPKPAILTKLPTEEEVKAAAIRNYPNIPVDVAITMEKDKRVREEAMKSAGFPAGTPERRTGAPIYR